MSEAWQVITGDCLDVLPTLAAGSVDAVVTDPPYGLKILNEQWDHGVPGVHFWTEVLRVAKPGAHLLAFGGSRTHHRLMAAIEDAGWELRDTLMWIYGNGYPKGRNLNGAWAGWGTTLKPAWEPIIMARKRLQGVIAENIQRWGTGALNIEGCKISVTAQSLSSGRWPANVIHDGSAEAIERFPHNDYSGSNPRGYKAYTGERTGKAYEEGNDEGHRHISGLNVKFYKPGYSEKGSAARYFFCARASNADREEGNDHPTVKPTSLMRYLCRLITPPGGVILDPFAGSGSTGKAAMLEGFRFLGIELQEDYADIARARIAKAAEQARQMELPL